MFWMKFIPVRHKFIRTKIKDIYRKRRDLAPFR